MKKFFYWLLAVVITLALSIFQRMTGPTYPKKVTVELHGESSQVKLPRSGVQHDEIVVLNGFPSDTSWKDGELQAALPVQPVGGKLQYYITVGGKDYSAEAPIVIRFRNDVPAGILIPHILFMFGAMLIAVYTFIQVVMRKTYDKWLKVTVLFLFVGGFVFGPLVQHAAFGPWWTGFPYGTDLTDNKTLLSFLFFVVSLVTLKWKYNKWLVSLAVLFMIAVFTIPHSAYGSEYDYTTQQLGTAK